MIKSFKCKHTEKIFHNIRVKKFDNFERQARIKLRYLNHAINLQDLGPGNRLEQLSGNRKGQYSIRINQQWRVCFLWKNEHAHNIEIVDYH